jgi:tetratricopeptide (TPR) repeat protein
MRHVDESELGRPAALRDNDLVRHAAACEECSRRMTDARRLRLHHEFLRIADRLAEEKDAARAILPQLAGNREALAEGEATLGLVHELRSAIEEALGTDPARALELTSLALAILGRLDPGDCPDVLRETEAVALGRLRAAAFRLLSRFAEALGALDAAEARCDDLPDSDYQLATVDLARAIVLQELGRGDEASGRLDSVAEVFDAYGDQRRAVHALLVKGAIAFDRCEFGAAGEIFTALIARPEMGDDPETLARLHNNLAQCRSEEGDFDDATDHLIRAIHLFSELGLDVEKRRSVWVLAQLAMKRGSFDAAAGHFLRLSDEFAAIGMTEEAALCRLDLTEALLALGRAGEAREAAARALEEFGRANLGRRAMTAVMYLREAIAAGGASRESVGRTRSALRSAGLRPRLFVD